MSHLLSNNPLVIDFPPNAELNEAFFTAALQSSESAFAMYQQLADTLAKIIHTRNPDADRSPYLAIGESCAMLSHSLKTLESWADQYPEDGAPYWFFCLRKGVAFSVIPDVNTKPVSPITIPLNSPSIQIVKVSTISESEPDKGIDLSAKPSDKAHYLRSLRQLFHRLRSDNIETIIRDFMSEVGVSSFYFDPEQIEALRNAFQAIRKAESAE